jgi:hypothetical protein
VKFSCTLAALALAALLSIGDNAAEAADVTVTSAKVQAGKLLITGTTPTAGMKVRLDGQTAAAFTVTSNASKAFTFNIVYHPGDCIVALQKFTPPLTLGTPTNAVVADCGPRGIVPRGLWSAATPYLTNDLVTAGGSSWRAKRNNTNKLPATISPDWEKFVAKGDTGSAGPGGPVGANGPPGAQGQGIQGPQGNLGPVGPQGPEGQQGVQGTTGIVTTVSLNGPGGNVPAAQTDFAFVTPTVNVDLSAGQRLTASASVAGKSTATTQMWLHLCYRVSTATFTPTLFVDNGYQVLDVTTVQSSFATSATVELGLPGTYSVGLCMKNNGNADVSLGRVNGWVQVTN